MMTRLQFIGSLLTMPLGLIGVKSSAKAESLKFDVANSQIDFGKLVTLHAAPEGYQWSMKAYSITQSFDGKFKIVKDVKFHAALIEK